MPSPDILLRRDGKIRVSNRFYFFKAGSTWHVVCSFFIYALEQEKKQFLPEAVNWSICLFCYLGSLYESKYREQGKASDIYNTSVCAVLAML